MLPKWRRQHCYDHRSADRVFENYFAKNNLDRIRAAAVQRMCYLSFCFFRGKTRGAVLSFAINFDDSFRIVGLSTAAAW